MPKEVRKSLKNGLDVESVLSTAGVIAKHALPPKIRTHVDTLFATKQIAQNFYEQYLEDFPIYREGDGVSEPAIGSVLWHDLIDTLSHSGIYVGGGQIVHLTGKLNGSRIEQCDSQTFSGGKIIFVSCLGKRAIGDLEVAKRALALVGQARDYHLFKNNCHGFIVECLGQSVEGAIYARKPSQESARILGMDCWRVWKV
ncbi:lecithin retinol acyltransferase family protein [Helicobacter felis]|uniref:lecithin retinol acyltransferase family protein n=1 Tax=Helicobacter felis TaxID=214 RepID=UPI000CEEB260|nr:lecithin retinol acyltransferase family protein [Helicobacter felis]